MDNALIAKLDDYLLGQAKMEDQSTIQIIGAAVAGIFATLGLPKLWEALFGHLSKKHTAKMSHDTELAEMKDRMTKIVYSVDMLLIIIKHKFEQDESIKTAIEKVESILHEETDDLQDVR